MTKRDFFTIDIPAGDSQAMELATRFFKELGYTELAQQPMVQFIFSKPETQPVTTVVNPTPVPVVKARKTIPEGKGIFVWVLKDVVKGDLGRWIAEVQAAKFDWVALKICEADKPFGNTEDQALTAKAVSALRSVGVQVGGWHYVYGTSPEAEAAVAVKVTRDLDLDFYAIDAEKEYKQVGRAKAAQIYIDLLASGLSPAHGIGLCSYRYPRFHQELPWKELLSRCDFHMPQVYFEGSHNPAFQLGRSVAELSALKAMPVIPIGSAYGTATWKPTVDDLKQFAQTAKSIELCRGYGWWAWHSAYPVREWWDEIKAQAWKA